DSGTGIATIECVFKYSNGKLAYSETRTVPLADLDSYGVEGAFFQATPDGAVQAVQNSIATMQEISDRIDAGLSFSDYEKILPPEMRLVEEPNKPGQKRMDCIEYVKTKIGIDVEDTANLNKTENPEPGKTAVIYSTSNDPNPSANPFWVDHTGIYLGKDAEGRIWVRSKWGYNGPVFDHLIDFVPPEYGTAVGFYTSNAGQASPSAQPEVTGKPIQATLQADQLVAVHMTDYFPDNGIIRTNGNSTSSTSRQTIHFSLNGASFIEVSGGDWTNKRFAILVPFEDLQDRVISFWARDTIIFGNFELPESAVIIGREEDLAGKNPGEASVKAIKEEEWPRNEGFKLNLVYVPEVVRSMGYTPAGLSRNVDKRVVVDDKYMYLERHSWEYVNSETPILKEGSSIDLRYSEAHWDSAFEELAQRLGLSTLHHESTLPGKLEAFLSDAQVYFLGDFIGPSLLYGSYGIVVLDVRPQSMIDTIASLTILIYKEQFYKGDEQKQAVFNIRTLSEDVISRMERKYNIKLDPQLRQEFDNLPKYETGQTSP
ncbi:MAG: hypothetical protein NT067_02985, partial [Candidatus Diapherotrites archaeon]|nr:hypothetical protein [Candidatus Diapherotrites archaeon]